MVEPARRDHSRRTVLRSVATSGVLAGGSLAAIPASAQAAPDSSVRRVADEAMNRFDEGWRTGEWAPFLALLTDEFSFWFPEEPARGRFEGAAGRRAIEEWATFHGTHGNRVAGERRRTTVAGDRVFYEYESRGTSPSTAGYVNWELIVVGVRGGRICSLHEYFGDARPGAAL